MARLDWSQCPAVESIPGKVSGLFDQATPVPIRSFLTGHSVSTAARQGWAQLRNGDLLAAAEASGFDIFLTTDRNIKYQQNLGRRAIAIIVLSR